MVESLTCTPRFLPACACVLAWSRQTGFFRRATRQYLCRPGCVSAADDHLHHRAAQQLGRPPRTRAALDRALPWHKMVAVSAIFNGLIHQGAFYVGGRGDTMKYARQASHHIFKHVTKAYGMEVTGALRLCICNATRAAMSTAQPAP
jgi:hypothetical protein